MTRQTAVSRIEASRISACNGGNVSMAIDQGVRSKRETRADAQSVIDLAHKQGLKIVDLKFIDLIGTWQHFSIPVQELTKGLFSEGIGFDGSSIRGFQQIHESDMLLIPDPSTAIVDPVLRVPTLSISCDVIDPITRQPYSRDPRYVGKKAEAFLLSTGIADTSFFGPECEFYIFNSMRFDQNQFSGMYERSEEHTSELQSRFDLVCRLLLEKKK